MSRPHKTIDYLPNGKAVCYEHHLRVCGICCVDHTFDEDIFDDEDEEEDEDEDDGQEYENPWNPDAVFILSGPNARFLPQSDDQIVGPSANRSSPAQASPTVAQPTFHFCVMCGLTWLVGEKGVSAASNHPSHHTLSFPRPAEDPNVIFNSRRTNLILSTRRTLDHEYEGTSRSVVVWVDGACPGNGSPQARAGIGVYFGPESRYNISEALPKPAGETPTSQKAELMAAARTLRTVCGQVVPARQTMCAAAARGDKSAERDAAHFRLVLVTDSSYLVECMCEHMPNWTENTTRGVLQNKKGKVIVNSKELIEVLREVKILSRWGVQVAWYHVQREENVHADRLARKMIPKVC